MKPRRTGQSHNTTHQPWTQPDDTINSHFLGRSRSRLPGQWPETLPQKFQPVCYSPPSRWRIALEYCADRAGTARSGRKHPHPSIHDMTIKKGSSLVQSGRADRALISWFGRPPAARGCCRRSAVDGPVAGSEVSSSRIFPVCSQQKGSPGKLGLAVAIGRRRRGGLATWRKMMRWLCGGTGVLVVA